MKEDIENKKYLNLQETAQLMNISERLMRKLSHQQGFPCIRFERKILVCQELLKDWFAVNSNKFIK